MRAGKYAQNCVCCVPRPLSVPPSARPPSSALGKNTQYDTATESRLLHSSPALERMHGPFARAHVRTYGWMPLLGSASLYMYHHLASAYTASQYASKKKKKSVPRRYSATTPLTTPSVYTSLFLHACRNTDGTNSEARRRTARFITACFESPQPKHMAVHHSTT